MVTIDDLTVTVRIEGSADADERAFVRLFNRYIQSWYAELRQRQHQERRSAADRAIGGVPGQDGGAF